MRQNKKVRFKLIPRKKLTPRGKVTLIIPKPQPPYSKSQSRSDDDDDDDDDDGDYWWEGGGLETIQVESSAPRSPEFTGILTEDAIPIFRFFMPKPEIGFLSTDVEDYNPEAYAYGLHPAYGSAELDDALDESSDEEDEED